MPVMRQILGGEYEQMLLLAPTVEDWIGPEHPARFIREFVGALELKELGLDTLEREQGGVAYEPALLLQAWLYGYYRKVRSTRALEAACQDEMGFVWLTCNRRPDHNALWRYWSAHRGRIKGLFQRSVRVAIDLQLVGLAVQAIDGTKIQAACSGRGGYDRAQLEKLLGELERQVEERERQIGVAGNEAAAALPPELARAVQLRERVRAALQRIEAGPTRHVHPLEPEAARMGCEGRNRFAYNAQAAVDAKAQIIVAAEVTNQANDAAQLAPMLAQAQAAEPTAQPTTLADGGYANAEQLSAAAAAGHDVVTPPPNGWRDTSDPYHAAHFRHERARGVVICPQGRELPLHHVRQKDGRRVEVYRSARVCKDCPVRDQCTGDRHGRSIDIQPGHAAVVAGYARWQHPQTAELYGLRAATVEGVFAQIKQQMGFRRWSVRGLEQVRAQWAMLATTWNLKVIYRRWRDDRRAGPEGPRGPGARPPGETGTAGGRSATTRPIHPRAALLLPFPAQV